MSYEDYLQVLLMAKGKQDKVLRGMDMIECSVREKGKRPGFQMEPLHHCPGSVCRCKSKPTENITVFASVCV